MVRLWHAVGVFRMLSVAVLVLGVVAAAQLSAARQSQQRMLRAAHTAQSAHDDQREVAERQRISAVSRAAQREADAVASAAADQTKMATQAAPTQASAKPSASASASAKPSPSTSPFGPIPASCSEYTGNVAIGCALMLEAGYGLDQMPCLKNLWMKESGWRTNAGTASGAYGIPQALPGSKMGAYGADWRTNPATQIKWGLNYVKTKYKTPCGAWSNFQSKGYY